MSIPDRFVVPRVAPERWAISNRPAQVTFAPAAHGDVAWWRSL
jgi:hypothetical protein